MSGIRVVHDICYHPEPGEAHSSQHLDVYAPEDAEGEKLPVVIFLHGGGWRRGSRRSNVFHFFQNVGYALAEQGFVAVLPSYRLGAPDRRKSLPFAPWVLGLLGAVITVPGLWLGQRRCSLSRATLSVCFSLFGAFALTLRQLVRKAGVRHPSHVEDCALAVQWAADGGASAFGGDPEQLVLCGHSAGGHIAALLALPLGFLSRPLRGLIAISGVYCGRRFWDNWFTRATFSYVFEGEEWDACFPLGRCPDPDGQALAGLCPVLLLNAQWDVGLRGHAEDFARRLRACGAEVEGPVVLPGTDHFRMMLNLGRTRRTGTPSREDSALAKSEEAARQMALLPVVNTSKHWKKVKSKMARGDGAMPYSPNFRPNMTWLEQIALSRGEQFPGLPRVSRSRSGSTLGPLPPPVVRQRPVLPALAPVVSAPVTAPALKWPPPPILRLIPMDERDQANLSRRRWDFLAAGAAVAQSGACAAKGGAAAAPGPRALAEPPLETWEEKSAWLAVCHGRMALIAALAVALGERDASDEEEEEELMSLRYLKRRGHHSFPTRTKGRRYFPIARASMLKL
ncbi:unnamed protein product [Effrenium voratum]|nr:unnamed protein product [Effrenium voratum]